MQGESYEEWLERTRPGTVAPTTDTRRWDVAVCVLLAVFFLWVGGQTAVVGLALVAVLAVEQVVVARAGDGAPGTVGAGNTGAGGAGGRQVRLRGAVLGVTLLLAAWIVWLEGVPAAPLPLLLVLLDVKDDRSFLRRVRGRMLRG